MLDSFSSSALLNPRDRERDCVNVCCGGALMPLATSNEDIEEALFPSLSLSLVRDS